MSPNLSETALMCTTADSPSERTGGRTDGRTQLWNYLASFQVCDIASWHGRGGGDADCASLLRPRRRAGHQEWCQDRMLPKKLREERRCQTNSSVRQLLHIVLRVIKAILKNVYFEARVWKKFGVSLLYSALRKNLPGAAAAKAEK